jgi:hypothetical protein
LPPKNSVFRAWKNSGANSITVSPAQDGAGDLIAELPQLNPPLE